MRICEPYLRGLCKCVLCAFGDGAKVPAVEDGKTGYRRNDQQNKAGETRGHVELEEEREKTVGNGNREGDERKKDRFHINWPLSVITVTFSVDFLERFFTPGSHFTSLKWGHKTWNQEKSCYAKEVKAWANRPVYQLICSEFQESGDWWQSIVRWESLQLKKPGTCQT